MTRFFIIIFCLVSCASNLNDEESYYDFIKKEKILREKKWALKFEGVPIKDIFKYMRKALDISIEERKENEFYINFNSIILVNGKWTVLTNKIISEYPVNCKAKDLHDLFLQLKSNYNAKIFVKGLYDDKKYNNIDDDPLSPVYQK